MRISDRDLEALRIGIREQERADLEQERFKRDFDRAMKRERVDEPQLCPADYLQAGDKLLACDFGHSFYVYATVLRVSPVEERPDDLWIDMRFEHGTGGHRFKRTDRVLRKMPASGLTS